MKRIKNQKNTKPFPAWAAPEALRWAWWGWEPLAERQRSGGRAVPYFGVCRWSAQWHKTLYSEATIRRMRALGINFAVTHFFKGFGLKHEHAEMMEAKKFVRDCHRHGIRVAGYTQFRSLHYEAFLNEQPKSAGWIQRKADNTLGSWGGSYHRWTPCINSREFISYLKKVIDYGAGEIGLDAFHFDNSYAGPCYCPRCKALFRKYLKKNVTKQSRMGLINFSKVEFPLFANNSADINDPLYQEWIRFRVECLSDTWQELYRYVKSINPDLCVITNPAFPRSPGWANRLSVHPHSFGRFTDLMFAENGNFPCMRGKNPITQIRAFKTSEACGYRVIPTAWLSDKKEVSRCPENGQEVKLSLAEAAAFGGIVGTTWALRTSGVNRLVIDKPGLAEALKAYMSFLDRHRDLYAGAVTAAPVGMLHSFESFAFRADTACERFMGLEQALITASIPYDVLFEEALDDIGRYPLVVVAGQVCLSDATLERLRDYARRGGKLIITPESGAHDENGLERECNGFDNIVNKTSVIRLKPPRKTENIRESVKWIYTQVVAVPADGLAFVSLIRKMLGAGIPYRISAPAGVVANWTKLPDSRFVLHLLNYNAEKNGKKSVQVSIRFSPNALSGRKYSIYQPERAPTAATRLSGRSSTIKIKSLNTYAAIVVG